MENFANWSVLIVLFGSFVYVLQRMDAKANGGDFGPGKSLLISLFGFAVVGLAVYLLMTPSGAISDYISTLGLVFGVLVLVSIVAPQVLKKLSANGGRVESFREGGKIYGAAGLVATLLTALAMHFLDAQDSAFGPTFWAAAIVGLVGVVLDYAWGERGGMLAWIAPVVAAVGFILSGIGVTGLLLDEDRAEFWWVTVVLFMVGSLFVAATGAIAASSGKKQDSVDPASGTKPEDTKS